MSYFRQSRNVELSLLYFLENSLSADWPGTTVAKTFKQVYAKDVSLPIVLVLLIDTTVSRREIGANTLEYVYLLTIDIFAENDGARLDMADYVVDKIKGGWIHYDHERLSGVSGLSRFPNGRDTIVEFITNARVNAGETVDTKDKYRHTITVSVRTSAT
jgi:hypothetical protein